MLFFSPGLHDLLFLLYFNFTIKRATFVAIFTWVHLCRLPCACTEKYLEAIQNKRKRKHLNIWRRKTRATYTIALTQNITIYQNGLPWVVKKRAISWRKKWWSIKFLPYQPLKHIVKLSIKLNFFLYLFEWITCQYQSLSRLILLNNTLYKKIILKDKVYL